MRQDTARAARLLHAALMFVLGLFVCAAPAWADDPPPPVTRKVAVIIQSPTVTINGLEASLYKHQEPVAMYDPYVQTETLYNLLRYLSGGYVNYETAVGFFSDRFPVDMNGFQYTPERYVRCLSNENSPACMHGNELDYAKLFKDYGLCDMIRAGHIDEVMLFGGPWFGYDEFAWKIPGDRMPYATPSTETLYWIYEGRRKNLPDCGRSYFVMGFNYATPIQNALHSYAHRVESALTLTVGRGRWEACGSLNTWDRFTCNEVSNSSEDLNAGCGAVHAPPNAARVDLYDYDNRTHVAHDCGGWRTYPDPPPVTVTENCDAWNCTEYGFITWWLDALPENDGYTIDGNLRNWWAYVVDYDASVSVLPLAPDLDTVDLTRLAGNPQVGHTVTWGHRARNRGATGSASFDVRWLITRDNDILKSATLRHAPLPARVTDRSYGDPSAQFSYTFTQPGRYRLHIVLDPDDHILETDKLNNHDTGLTVDVP